MTRRPDKEARKQALAQWKADQRAAARTSLPLPDNHLRSLFDTLDIELSRTPCDHTLKMTRTWLASHRLAEEPVIAWLHENGGYCDCEALANAEEAWRNAARVVDR